MCSRLIVGIRRRNVSSAATTVRVPTACVAMTASNKRVVRCFSLSCMFEYSNYSLAWSDRIGEGSRLRLGSFRYFHRDRRRLTSRRCQTHQHKPDKQPSATACASGAITSSMRNDPLAVGRYPCARPRMTRARSLRNSVRFMPKGPKIRWSQNLPDDVPETRSTIRPSKK